LTNPKEILSTLHLIRAGLGSGLLSKEEVIAWADKIISKDEQPDIFFIELALLKSKSTNEVLYYFSDYLNFEKAVVPGRPLLGLLYKQYKNGAINLEQTVKILFHLMFETTFTNAEETYIYVIDDGFDCATQNIYGTIEDVQNETEKFLSFYKDYSIENFEQWSDLDKDVEQSIEADHRSQQEQNAINKNTMTLDTKPWWKLW
jgi:hypothetical protein